MFERRTDNYDLFYKLRSKIELSFALKQLLFIRYAWYLTQV